MNNTYDVIITRTYKFDKDGHYAENKEGKLGEWEIRIEEREILIPTLVITHIHARSNGSGGTKVLLDSVDTTCVCGSKFPKRILDDVYTINKTKYPKTYASIERAAYYKLNSLKQLAEQWFLDENDKQQPEPSLFHVCNEYHPAYMYYGKGIPLSQIAMPPWPDKCKTCHVDIPKGIRVALLMMHKRIKL